MNKPTKTNQNRPYRLFMLLLPFALFFISVLLTAIGLRDFAAGTNPFFRLATGPSRDSRAVTQTEETDESRIILPPESTAQVTGVPESTTQDTGTAETTGISPETEKQPPAFTVMPASSFPVIRYGEQWATLNAEGWEMKNIPVYFGDSDEILAKGAGMQFASRFCGQNGKTVLSAHVTSHFYEIGDTEAGDNITIDTVYGRYIYEVEEIVLFDYTDNTLLLSDEGNNSLVMYTCWPREDGFAFKEKRIALVCGLTEGVLWTGR